jgi:uncharacterized repeat protein (TIGR03803 family)
VKRNTALLLVSLLTLTLFAGARAARAEIAATILHSFDGDDGLRPRGPLVDGGDGYLYGTTPFGGSGVLSPGGTVYRITPAGDLTTLYTFEFQVTGDSPFEGVLRLADGTLLGTTRGSGAYVGNVFQLDAANDFTNLHTFTGYFGGADGGHPEAQLAAGADGNFYGTTLDGGATNLGSLYRIDSNGGYTLLHSFSGGLGVQDGGQPRSALVLGDDDALYGTTSAAGPSQPSPSTGTVFRFTPGVSGVTTIRAFRGSDGTGPNTLVKGLDGNLYGTTTGGGAHSQGTVFQLGTNGDFATLHSFGATPGEGTSPVGLTAGSDGNLYGTTSTGGEALGTIFRVRPNSDFTTLFAFKVSDVVSGGGSSPQGPLVQVGTTLYGTTFLGGAGGDGTVFALTGISVPESAATSAGAAAVLGLAVARRRRSARTS